MGYPYWVLAKQGSIWRLSRKDDTAHQRGWYAYMNVGVPLIEERRDILQPPPDVICEQTYVNGTDPAPVQWTNTANSRSPTQSAGRLRGRSS